MRTFLVLLATALLVTGCGSEAGEPASATSDAPQLLSATVNNLAQLDSATMDLKVDATPPGGAPASVHVQGPFQAGEKGETPKFSLAATMQSGGRTQAAGATWTGEQAFATLDGKTYEVPSLFAGQLSAGVEQAFGTGGPLIGIDLKRWVPNPVNAGTAQVGGVETVKLTGEADVKRVLADVNLLTGQLQQLQVPGMSPTAPRKLSPELADEVKSLTVTVYTGVDDQILRRLVVDGDSKSSGAVQLDLTLTKVGDDQEIAVPTDTRPFDELLQSLRTG